MTCTIIVPCYNEAERLDRNTFMGYLEEHSEIAFVFVNDGSIDRTGVMLEELHEEVPGQVEVLHQGANAGKAEAVRAGLLYALNRARSTYVGFWDADLATPLEAISDLQQVFSEYPEVDVVLGSRVKLLGRNIERQPIRHYLGRVFATCASLVLDLPVYDTQCGAKLFRVTPALVQVLQQPFRSRWIFDVELIARFLQIYSTQKENVQNSFYEFPLRCWRDVAGSKVRGSDFLRAAKELWIIRKQYFAKSAQVGLVPQPLAGKSKATASQRES